MLIERLKLNDFRNYESLLLRPDSGLNVIVGENAQGKTNAVEAIFLCAFGRSHRTAKDAELIRAGFAGGYVGMDIRTKSGSRTIEIKLKSGERKQIFIDKLMAKRTGELMGALNAVLAGGFGAGKGRACRKAAVYGHGAEPAQARLLLHIAAL